MDPAPSSDPPQLSFDSAEALLGGPATVELLGLMPHSSNYTFLVSLLPAGGDGDARTLAVYKPARGESPLWDFPAGLHRREVAAYRLSRLLGWPLIPPTVTRTDGPHGVGSVQLFIEANAGEDFFAIRDGSPEQLLAVAAFDVIANNADRKAGHHLLDAGGRVWVIDHGLTFHVEPKLRTVIWDFAGEPLPVPLRRDLERVAGTLTGGGGKELLGGLLSTREQSVLRRRVEGMTDPAWRFPAPVSAWSVPWPPV
ncbi:MAG: SCO1664 family protein [Candidatus Dormibacteraceae bacterium]